MHHIECEDTDYGLMYPYPDQGGRNVDNEIWLNTVPAIAILLILITLTTVRYIYWLLTGAAIYREDKEYRQSSIILLALH